jgi:hypothetical protein
MKSIVFAVAITALLANASCSEIGTKSENSSQETMTPEEKTKQEEAAKTEQAFLENGVITPTVEDRSVTLEPAVIQSLSDQAAGTSGSRTPYEAFHNEVAPLLPVQSAALALAPALECATVTADGGPAAEECKEAPVVVEDPKKDECPDKVCATACASASATAYAAAFAHASVRACAFASAWACVWSSVPPFGKVCAWAQSEACASAFAAAFAFGVAHDSDQECKTVCSDGTTTTTKGPAAAQ